MVHGHYCKIFTHVVPLEGKSLTQENVAMLLPRVSFHIDKMKNYFKILKLYIFPSSIITFMI